MVGEAVTYFHETSCLLMISWSGEREVHQVEEEPSLEEDQSDPS